MDVVFKNDRAVFNFRVAGIWIENGHVLLHRDVNESSWSLPGGRVEMAEEAKASIKREFREELDMDITVDRLIWIVENFFEYAGKEIHELGMYFLVSSNSSNEIDGTPFHGVEGDRLIYRWTPIKELGDIELYPEFLREAINNLPEHTEHIVQRQ